MNNILIDSIDFYNYKMFIELNTKRVLSIPYTYTKKLKSAKLEDLKDYRLITF